MTKEEFLDRYQKCSDAIRAAEDNLLNLKGEYLEEKVQELDAAFPYGTKVRVTKEAHQVKNAVDGFVVGWELCCFTGDVVPRLNMIKKDGTMGNRPIGTTFTVTGINSIEKI